MDDLTERQQEIMDFILKEVETKGYPPSVREIGEAVGLSSSSSVHAQLEKLEQLGYLRRDPTKPRAIEVLYGGPVSYHEKLYKDLINVPIVGAVTAGTPIFAEQNIQDYFPLPKDFFSGLGDAGVIGVADSFDTNVLEILEFKLQLV